MDKPLRILIVEDSEDDTELLVTELERSGYNLIYQQVDTSSAMNAALAQNWDLVIADYTMPNFSAPAALALLKEKALDLPFIIVSGSIGEDTAVAAMKAGAHDYVMKGKLARLAPAVERELREASERRKRREAEQAVRQNQERFRSLIENGLDIITVLDAEGIIDYESPSIEKILGYKPENLIGKNIIEYIHSEDQEHFLETLNQTIKNVNLSLNSEFRFQHQDGSWRIFEAVGKACFESINYAQKLSVVVNSRDITERKRAEETRHNLERERELSEARFNFVSMMSHEFRNPLGTIITSGELLKNYSHKTTPVQKERCLDRIEDAAQEMMQLLNDILNLSRAEVGQLEFNPQPLYIEEFCQNLVEGIQLSTSAEYSINLVISGECTQACMDEKLLGHILNNLLSNAIKYSPKGGKVQLELACEKDEAVFLIQDWGIGIPEQEQQKLFESFYRGQNVGKIPGTGLGLCLVKKFVDLHKGKISLKSQVGVGTTFKITLPLHSPCLVMATGYESVSSELRRRATETPKSYSE
ncbi:MAG: ATP-binding protein [Coleofasciculaceae cyanobacterium]